MEEERNIIDKKGLYDDCYYPLENYIEHKQIINKVDLFDAFSTDIIARYTHYCSQPSLTSPQPSVPELRIGYILYINPDISESNFGSPLQGFLLLRYKFIQIIVNRLSFLRLT